MTANTSAKSGLRLGRQNKHNPGVEKPTAAMDEIRRHAYELYEQRGGEQGHDIEDWLQAEKEVTQQRKSRRAA